MAVIDLDRKIKVDNTVNVRIAGKEYSLVFDDDFTKLVSKTYIDVMSNYSKFDDPNYVDKNINDQKHDVDVTIKSTRETAITSLDKLLGKGEGKRLYNYYNHSTAALGAVIGALQQMNQNSIEVKGANKPAVVNNVKSNR